MTEDAKRINLQCRIADIARWQTQNFVMGYEIHLSNTPNQELIKAYFSHENQCK